MRQLPPHMQPPPRPTTILEVGVGRFDNYGQVWAAPTITLMELGPDQSYLGVDIGAISLAHELSGEEIEEADDLMRKYWSDIRQARPSEYIEFIQADATKLPCKDETFDRIIANNLYGSGAPDNTLVNILKESKRLLRPGGEIVIHDDHTPTFHTHEQLETWFENNGIALSPHNPPRRIFPSRSAYLRYGLPTFTPSDPEYKSEKIRFEGSTLWILGKTSFTDTVAPPAK